MSSTSSYSTLINNCSVSGSITSTCSSGSLYMGGICGMPWYVLISYCGVATLGDLTLTATNHTSPQIGGITRGSLRSAMQLGRITNCEVATGEYTLTISAPNATGGYYGGISSWHTLSYISDCVVGSSGRTDEVILPSVGYSAGISSASRTISTPSTVYNYTSYPDYVWLDDSSHSG